MIYIFYRISIPITISHWLQKIMFFAILSLTCYYLPPLTTAGVRYGRGRMLLLLLRQQCFRPAPPPPVPPQLSSSRVSSRRRFGTKCSGCLQGISPQDLVRKARDRVFHLKCFTCCVCRKQLSTGEELYVLEENKFVCKQDYMSGKLTGKKPRRKL